MTFQTTKYRRRPFEVDAVQITDSNMEELADWCNGKIRQSDERGEGIEKYIFVHVHTPMHERQKMGFVGMWLLKTDKGFKIYTEQAFHKMFEPVDHSPSPSPEALEAMAENLKGLKPEEWKS